MVLGSFGIFKFWLVGLLWEQNAIKYFPEYFVCKEPSVLSASYRSWLFTEKKCRPQDGYNYFEVGGKRSPWYFMIATCSEQSGGLLCVMLEIFVFNPKKTREDETNLIHQQKTQNPPYSAFVCKRHNAHRCHTNVKPIDNKLSNAVLISFWSSLELEASEVFRKGSTSRPIFNQKSSDYHFEESVEK